MWLKRLKSLGWTTLFHCLRCSHGHQFWTAQQISTDDIMELHREQISLFWERLSWNTGPKGTLSDHEAPSWFCQSNTFGHLMNIRELSRQLTINFNLKGTQFLNWRSGRQINQIHILTNTWIMTPSKNILVIDIQPGSIKFSCTAKKNTSEMWFCASYRADILWGKKTYCWEEKRKSW